MSGSVTVLKNSTVTYTIEKEGYTTVTNTVVVSEDTSTTVTMDLALVTLTIEPDPSDATVTLTAAGYTQSGNSISVAPGTTVNYSVSKDGYTTVTGSEVCTINRTINCTLEEEGVNVTVNIEWHAAPAHIILYVNGVEYYDYEKSFNETTTYTYSIPNGSVISFHTDSFGGGNSEVSLTNGNATTTASPEVSVYQIDSAYLVNGDCSFYVYSSIEK